MDTGLKERRMGGARWGLAVMAAAIVLAGASPLPFQEQTTPNSEARLISDVASIQPGEPFTVGVHIILDEGWHTYWKNAGDAGNGLALQWSLPAGFEAGPILWPRPEKVPYPPLMNYGYNDEVVFPVRITPPADLAPGSRVRLSTRADFLVCEDVCLPASATLSLELPVRAAAAERSRDAGLVDRYVQRLPLEAADIGWGARVAETGDGFVLAVRPPEGWDGSLAGAYFFPEHTTALSHTADQPAGTAAGPEGEEVRLRLTRGEYLSEEIESLAGVLVLPEGSALDDVGHRSLALAATVERGEAAVAWAQEPTTPLAPVAAGAGGAGGLSLVAALFFAFLGGVLLNLMPCVFPILSLKALGFATHAGDRSGMRRHGLAFGAGVVLTFLFVAGLLMAVRASGAEVGWGYQLQSPAVVALLAGLMVAIGLMLAGVYEFGASLTRLGGMGSGDGYSSSFATGILATIVATPCTAPFMGAAVGTALIRPPVEGLAVFAGLGLGMAAPYVTLSFWPAMARRLPKPGRWMETFKQFLAFPMFAVAVWLLWVFGLQVGVDAATRLLFGLLFLALGLWILGRWPATTASTRTRIVTRTAAAVAMVIAVLAGLEAARAEPPALATTAGGTAAAAAEWGEWSEARVAELREQGRPVFVDFTAAWCISCQVNERVALETEPARTAFAEHDVALLKADWTRRDPEITRALARFGRSGVPLYVMYPADPMAEPKLLPALLTPKIVVNAVEEAAASGSAVRQANVDGTRD